MDRFDDWTGENTVSDKNRKKIDLESLLRRSREWIANAAPDELRALHEEQRESWARGELGVGSDRDKADARDRYRAEQRGRTHLLD